jgi:DNA polymerase-4
VSALNLPIRTIIHVDLDAFYCAVEEQRDPSLRGKAFAVGGSPDGRGVVASCSYAARARGVHSAMAMGVALRLCPEMLVVPVWHSEYRAVSERVMAVLQGRTPLLEQISIDEAFLDVSALVSDALSGLELATQIQEQISSDLDLSCSLGVASNKMVAKIATDIGKASIGKKHSPRAICVVPFGEEAAFLAPLSVSALWGVGPKTAVRLNDLGIETIGDLAKWPERDLVRRFGKHGYELSQHARGIDKREIVTERESKSVSSETTFVRDVEDWETLHATLVEQATSVAEQLRKQNLQGATVKIKLRWTDFSIVTRQMTLLTPTAEFRVIEEAATELLKQLWRGERPVRLLGVGCANLGPLRQLGLFDVIEEPAKETEALPVSVPVPVSEQEPSLPPLLPSASEISIMERKQRRLNRAIEMLEARFGVAVVKPGSQIPIKDGLTDVEDKS